MADAPHVIGKILFQIEVPGEDSAQAVFEQISILSEEALPQVLSELFDTLHTLPGLRIRIDRLVLDAGILPVENFEREFLNNIEKALREALQAREGSGIEQASMKKPDERLNSQPGLSYDQKIATAAGTPVSRPQQAMALIGHFLIHGHFPWWATSEELAGSSLESLWLELLSGSDPGALRFLREMLDQNPARQRIIRQVSAPTLLHSLRLLLDRGTEPLSSPALRDMLTALFPRQFALLKPFLSKTAEFISAQYPGQQPESVVWQTTLRHLLTKPGDPGKAGALWNAVSRGLAKTLNMPPQALRKQLAFSAEAAAETAPGQEPEKPGNEALQATIEKQLLFFLESGRLPEGQIPATGVLEQTLLDLLHRFPERMRAMLLDLNRKIDLATRLARQFSIDVQRAVLVVLVPGQAAEIGDFLNRLVQMFDRHYPEQQTEALLWQTALRQVLADPATLPNIPSLWEVLSLRLAETLDVSPQTLRDQVSAWASGADGMLKTEEEAAAIEKPGAADQLRFFLESGHLSESEPVTASELEQTLLDLLRRFPERTRAMLLELNRKIDLATRLARQFSIDVQRAVLVVLVPGQAAEIGDFLNRLAQILARHYPEQQTEALLWQTALRQVLADPDTLPNIPSLWESISLRLAETLDMSPQTLWDQVSGWAPGAGGTLKTEEEPAAIEKPGGAGWLWAFLESGRLPESGPGAAGQLEQTLLDLLRQSPEQTRRLLFELNRKTNLASRLELHFSSALHREIIALLFSGQSTEIERTVSALAKTAAEIYPSAHSEPFIWKAALRRLLVGPGQGVDIPALWIYLVQQFAEYLGMPPERMLEQMAPLLAEAGMLPASVPELLYTEKKRVESRRDGAEQTLPENVRQLLYFLEWSRFPAGATAPASQLEQTLLDFLRDSPAAARQTLLDINRKINLASRLIQQFSPAAQREVIRILFPEQWPQIEALLRDLARLPGATLGEAFTSQTTLQRLLAFPARYPDFPALVEFLIRQIAEKENTSSAQLLQPGRLPEWQSAGFGAATLKYLILASGQLAPAELQALQHELERQPTEDDAQPGGTRAALDRLLFRLHRGETAWWDTPPQPTGQLILELTALPTETMRQAFRQLWTGKFREQWLPDLPDETFRQVLRAFWGDYADQAGVFGEAIEVVAVQLGLDAGRIPLREAFLELTLHTATVHSGLLLHAALRAAVQASGRSEQQWVRALENQAAAAIARGDIRFHRLRELLRQPEDIQAPERAELAGVPAREEPPGEQPPPNYPDLLRRDLQTLRHFLRFGTLAPDSDAEHPEALDRMLIRLAEKHPGLLTPVLREAFKRREGTGLALQYFGSKTWAALAALLWKPHFEAIAALWSALLSRFDNADGSRLNRHFFHYLFDLAGVAGPDSYDPLYFAEGLIRAVAEKEQFPEQYLWEQIQAEKPGAPKDVLGELLPALLQRRSQAARVSFEKHRPPTPEKPGTPPGEAIAIHNAGLVILAPYLQRYFDTLRLLENQVFIDAAATERGVHLLQYMASRQTKTPEHLLVLNKILCGMPTYAPVSRGIDLTEEEEKLSAFLLNTVLQNWEMMRNSTVANLQGAFILRNGLLREKPDKWQLHIEKKSYDIVLDYLPWTVSMVKLPWMEKRIEVEWKKKT